jgi:hypothetical protein
MGALSDATADMMICVGAGTDEIDQNSVVLFAVGTPTMRGGAVDSKIASQSRPWGRASAPPLPPISPMMALEINNEIINPHVAAHTAVRPGGGRGTFFCDPV